MAYEPVMKRIDNLQIGYQDLLKLLDNDGMNVGKRIAYYNVSLHTWNVKQNLVQDPRYSKFKWLLVEAADRMNAIVSGKRDQSYEHDKYSYLPPLANQFLALHNAMKRQKIVPYVLTIWDPRQPDTRILPCTVAYTFYHDGEYLHCTVHQRACDLINYFISDYFCHTNLFIYVAEILNYKLGRFTMHIDMLFCPKRRKERLAKYAANIPLDAKWDTNYRLYPDWAFDKNNASPYVATWKMIIDPKELIEVVQIPQFAFYTGDDHEQRKLDDSVGQSEVSDED